MVTLRNAVLPRGTYVKFRPQSSDFLSISNPKAVLEASLRAFSCLSRGDSVAIAYNNKTYWIDVLDVKPGDAISIVEADVNVDFEAPLDYVEPPPVYRNTPAGGAGAGPSGGGAGGGCRSVAGAAVPPAARRASPAASSASRRGRRAAAPTVATIAATGRVGRRRRPRRPPPNPASPGRGRR
eukprot:TRINITY_DN3928_c0_g1_i2.p1 TRINITY_DN3928_c0_g1~~TRINITY_DN3928_c0_g1_i2.p1  ORF type:complete len:182 (-),score=62.24 TRINITY_DN3928_c0_g1_i2:114-659(-)